MDLEVPAGLWIQGIPWSPVVPGIQVHQGYRLDPRRLEILVFQTLLALHRDPVVLHFLVVRVVQLILVDQLVR